MPHLDRRDILVTVLFGLASAWLWPSLIGVLSAVTQFPLLVSLSREFGPSIKPWVPAYMFGWEIVGGALCAIVIALPVGYLLRGRLLLLWVLFAALFLGGLAASLGDEDPSILLFVMSLPGPWVFLFWSAVFFIAGQKLRQRLHVA